MNRTTIAEILELTISERIRLVEDIWDSIAAVPDAISLTEKQKEELDRRLVEYSQHPETGIPWDKVMEKIKKMK